MAFEEAVKKIVHIYGVVQGVGFRPSVVRLAKQNGIVGTVRNDAGHVVIEAIGSDHAINAFIKSITLNAPNGSVIIRMDVVNAALPKPIPNDFRILESSREDNGIVMPSPDLAVCDECLKELYEPNDPRYLNPFISCTHCGPRYSIMRRIPYDRDTITMDKFDMCPICQRQYRLVADRRYHAQTICCNHCGPTLTYRDRQGMGDLDAAIAALQGGKIVAVKGIGGYHLACSPFDLETVAKLRRLKGREQKPFAVMFLDMDQVKAHCEINPMEQEALTSKARPIVLLKRKCSAIAQAVYTTSPYLGTFLPYTPLQHMLLSKTGPLIMTSANATEMPIMIDDNEMHSFFESHSELSGIICHDRAILRRLDDSVVKCVGGEMLFMRRARGYTPLAIPIEEGGGNILAVGAQEKSTICLYQDGFAYPSQEMGDLDTAQSEMLFEETVSDLSALLDITPDEVICDLHPMYASADYALKTGMKLTRVQHHHAHIASVMAEHALCEPVIGIAFDGTGYGTDGTIWGGEFLVVSPTEFKRAGHIKAVPLLGGDASVKQAWKSAECYLADAGVEGAQDDRARLVRAALKSKVNTVYSSSMGRMFDAVSAIMNICLESQYGGQAAIELENAAERAAQKGEALPFALKWEGDALIADLAHCIKEVNRLYMTGIAAEEIAYRFHVTVAQLISDACAALSAAYGIQKIVLGGGVFQNKLLVELTAPLLLAQGLTPYCARKMPPGDGGIALGQTLIGIWNKKEAALCASQCPEK